MNSLDRTQIEKDASSLPAQAKALRILGEKSLEKANEFLLGIKGLKQKINGVFDPIIRKAHEAHKEALAQKNQALQPALDAEVYIRGKIRDVLIERDRKIKEAEAANRKAEEEKQKALEKIVTPGPESADDQGIVDAGTLANLDFGKPIQDEIGPVSIDYEFWKKPKGTSLKSLWKFRIIDKAKVPLDYMIVDEVKIGKVVRATKGQITIPGIEPFEDKALNVR